MATQLGIVSVELIYLDLNRVFGGLELWRLLTNLLFFGGFGMPFVFNMFFLIRYSQGLEQARFQGRSADYVWCLATCAVVLTIVSAILGGFPFLAPALLSAIVYLWARISPTQPLSIFGLFTVQAFYFPWVLVMITVLMGGSPIPNLLGILAGHVYYFLVDVQGIPLRAPQFLCVPRGAPRAPAPRLAATVRCTAGVALARRPRADALASPAWRLRCAGASSSTMCPCQQPRRTVARSEATTGVVGSAWEASPHPHGARGPRLRGLPAAVVRHRRHTIRWADWTRRAAGFGFVRASQAWSHYAYMYGFCHMRERHHWHAAVPDARGPLVRARRGQPRGCPSDGQP